MNVGKKQQASVCIFHIPSVDSQFRHKCNLLQTCLLSVGGTVVVTVANRYLWPDRSDCMPVDMMKPLLRHFVKGT